MITIPELIQEIEKGCEEKSWIDTEKFYCSKNKLNEFKNWICPFCKEKINLLKQCQTIAEEREKKILEDILVRIDKLLKVRIGELRVAKEKDYQASRIIYNAQVEELQRVKAVIENNYKQQLNPAQTEDAN